MDNRVKFINLSTVFFIIAQLFIAYVLFKNNEIDYLYEVAAIIALMLAFTYWEIKNNINLNWYIQGLVIITLLLHTGVGDYLNLYTKSFVFDKLLHGFGTYSFTLFVYALINKLVKKQTEIKAYDFIFIISLGMALGQWFEFLEFAIDVFLKPSNPAQGNLLDTNLDMILNTVGAVIGALHLKFGNIKI